MKKLLLFSIFIGIFCSPVTYAASPTLPNNIGAIWNNDKYYICKEDGSHRFISTGLLDNTSAKNVTEEDKFIHSLGKISYTLWDEPEILYPNPATAYKFTCQSNGKFKMESPDYCSTSLHEDNTSFLNFGRYRFLSTYLDRSYHDTNTEQLESARKISYSACIHIGCATGYIYNNDNNTCENINTITNSICKEAKTYNYNEIPALITKLHTNSTPQYYQCGQTPGISNPGCLTVNNQGQGLYCMTKEAIGDSIKKDNEDLLKQTCIENEDYVILPTSNYNQPYPYYQCTANGWQEKTLEPCIAGHSHCNNVPDCVLYIFTKSGLDSSTPTDVDVSPFLSVTSINDYCYAVSCRPGFVHHNGQCISEQQDCTNTFGTWANNRCTCEEDKNLVPDTTQKRCECKPNHLPDETNKKCVPTDTEAEKIACDAADNATWGPVSNENETGKCTCQESGYEWNYDTNNQSGDCEKSEERAACDELGSDIATWDEDSEQCKCTDGGQEFRDGRCVDTAETIATAASSAITTTVDALNRLISGANLQTSKWKNAEGKFNTARLASDATAGIVLGTTSALITSKLVKKHQVQDGFEDIHCTIGGQTVADWGDEFTIGIQ